MDVRIVLKPFCGLRFQNVDDSKAFFKRKIDFLTKQIEKIQPALQEKHGMKQGRGWVFTSVVIVIYLIPWSSSVPCECEAIL